MRPRTLDQLGEETDGGGRETYEQRGGRCLEKRPWFVGKRQENNRKPKAQKSVSGNAKDSFESAQKSIELGGGSSSGKASV